MDNYIVKKSLAEEVAGRLKEHILNGYYEVGEKLPPEPELMKSFGVGRSTIREAIKILSNLQLLNVRQGVGTFVERKESTSEPLDQRLKRVSFRDLDEIRQVFEIKMAEKAAINRTEADIAIISKFLSARKASCEAGLLKECIEADINFHIAIGEASKNEILVDLYKSASKHLLERFIHIYKDIDIFIETQDLHEKLLKYIIAGESKKAWNTASKIIDRGIL